MTKQEWLSLWGFAIFLAFASVALPFAAEVIPAALATTARWLGGLTADGLWSLAVTAWNYGRLLLIVSGIAWLEISNAQERKASQQRIRERWAEADAGKRN